MELIFGIYKKFGRRKYQRGPPASHKGGGRALPPWARPPSLWAPWQVSDAHLLLYEVFHPRKNKGEAFGTKHRRHEAEPWRNQSRALAELFYRGHFPPGGGNHRHRHHQCFSHREGANLHQHLHQHHLLSSPTSSLVSNSCL